MLLDIALAGAVLAVVYAVVTAAVVIAHQRTGLLHLEMVAFFLLGVIASARMTGVAPPLAMIAASALAAVVSVVATIGVYRPVQHAPSPAGLIASLGVAVMIMALAVPWDPLRGEAYRLMDESVWRVGLSADRLWILLLEILLILLGVRFTRRLGTAPPTLDLRLLAALAALAAASGALLDLAGGSGAFAYRVLLLPLLAAVIGGFHSLRGSVVAAIAIALVQTIIERSACEAEWTLPILVLVACVHVAFMARRARVRGT